MILTEKKLLIWAPPAHRLKLRKVKASLKQNLSQFLLQKPGFIWLKIHNNLLRDLDREDAHLSILQAMQCGILMPHCKTKYRKLRKCVSKRNQWNLKKRT